MSRTKERRKNTKQVRHLRTFRDTETGEFVIRALKDPKWDYRTAEGIAKEARRPLEEVKVVLATDVRVRKSVMKNKEGKELYTLKVRKSKIGDYFSAFQSLNSDKLKG